MARPRQLRIPSPPKEQQAELAELLWAIDEVIEKDSNVSSIVKSSLHTFFKSLKQSHETVQLKEISRISNGTTPSTKIKDYWSNGTIPWLPTGTVHERFIRGSDTFITDLAIAQRKSKIFPKHSTLVAMIGDGKTRGSVAFLEIDAAINQNFACVTPHSMNPYYVFYCLSFCYDRLREISQGTNQLALNCDLIGNFRIPFVDEKKQKDFVDTLSKYDHVSHEIQTHIINAKALQKSLINEIF